MNDATQSLNSTRNVVRVEIRRWWVSPPGDSDYWYISEWFRGRRDPGLRLFSYTKSIEQAMRLNEEDAVAVVVLSIGYTTTSGAVVTNAVVDLLPLIMIR